jgi:hypothetical protein
MTDTEICDDCGDEFKNLMQHIALSDCELDNEIGDYYDTEFPFDAPVKCDECEMPVRRVVSNVTDTDYMRGHVEIEESVACECGGYVCNTFTAPTEETPDGWN